MKPEHLMSNKQARVVTTINLNFKDHFTKVALHPAEQDVWYQEVGWKTKLFPEGRSQGDEGI